MTKQKRKEIEEYVIKAFDILDTSHTNSEYYKKIFAGMSDSQFEAFLKKKYPFRMQYKPSVTEPSMSDIKNALDFIKVPLLEKITLPNQYVNEDGVPVNTKEALVVYFPHKKVQQFITKKNKWSIDTANRDMKSGRLIGDDKGAATSDREFESLAIQGLDVTMDEFSTFKADAMDAENMASSIIGTKGILHLDDVNVAKDDSLARNMMSVYLIGAHINSNLVNQGNYTPYTLKQKRDQIERLQ